MGKLMVPCKVCKGGSKAHQTQTNSSRNAIVPGSRNQQILDQRLGGNSTTGKFAQGGARLKLTR